MTDLMVETIGAGDSGTEPPVDESLRHVDLSNPSNMSEAVKFLQLPKGTNVVALVMASSTVIR